MLKTTHCSRHCLTWVRTVGGGARRQGGRESRKMGRGEGPLNAMRVERERKEKRGEREERREKRSVLESLKVTQGLPSEVTTYMY